MLSSRELPLTVSPDPLAFDFSPISDQFRDQGPWSIDYFRIDFDECRGDLPSTEADSLKALIDGHPSIFTHFNEAYGPPVFLTEASTMHLVQRVPFKLQPPGEVPGGAGVSVRFVQYVLLPSDDGVSAGAKFYFHGFGNKTFLFKYPSIVIEGYNLSLIRGPQGVCCLIRSYDNPGSALFTLTGPR